MVKSEKAAKKKGQEFDETTARYEAEKKQLDIIANKVGAQEAIDTEVGGFKAAATTRDVLVV